MNLTPLASAAVLGALLLSAACRSSAPEADFSGDPFAKVRLLFDS